MNMVHQPILVINTGSSSLKFGVYAAGDDERLLLEGGAERIGNKEGQWEVKDSSGAVLQSEKGFFESHGEALELTGQYLANLASGVANDHANEHVSALANDHVSALPGGLAGAVKAPLAAVGHRIVHGGPRLRTHQLLTPQVIAELESCVHFAPLHISISLACAKDAQKHFPGVPQFACFDTAFHATIPKELAIFALPSFLWQEGVKRYGFHGLSYESVVRHLGDSLPARAVIAHLGNGSSLAAVRDGHSIDTSMGFTPTGGIPMATRSGDIDPGVILYLLRTKRLDSDSLERLLNQESGLRALSGSSSDLRDLESAAQHGDASAQLAIEVFCTSISKTIASYAALLGGLDMVVFTGGIGENSSQVRARVCERLAFAGVVLSEQRNNSQRNNARESIISDDQSRVSIRVVKSEENLQISRHCRELLRRSGAGNPA